MGFFSLVVAAKCFAMPYHGTAMPFGGIASQEFDVDISRLEIGEREVKLFASILSRVPTGTGTYSCLLAN